MQQPQPPVNQREAEKYANDVLKKLESSPESLNPHEKRLAKKFQAGKENVAKILKDIGDMKNQIEQAQARLRSMELQLEEQQGRCNGFIEYLVDLKFTPEEEETPEPAKTAAPPENGNGAKAPVNRKERRAAESKARKEDKTTGQEAPAA